MWILPSANLHLFRAADLPHEQVLRVLTTGDYYEGSTARGPWVTAAGMTLSWAPIRRLPLSAAEPTFVGPDSTGAVTMTASTAPGASPGSVIFKVTQQKPPLPPSHRGRPRGPRHLVPRRHHRHLQPPRRSRRHPRRPARRRWRC